MLLFFLFCYVWFFLLFRQLNIRTMPDFLGTDQRKTPDNKNEEKKFQGQQATCCLMWN